MRVLVAIANYGFKNTDYLNRIIHEYQSMPCTVDIVILSDVSKSFEPGIEVVVGLPTRNPWSLPFGHKQIFAERQDDYDLFIYTEDDILIEWRNINSYAQLTKALPDDYISGFIRYELNSTGEKWFPDFVGPYHWIPTSVRKADQFTLAEFSNLHSACYVLTREQLRRVIGSGGYVVKPHEGRYDLLCTAATDPYTQCGLKKVIAISHISDVMVHHLSNRYSGELGIKEEDFHTMIKFMLSEKYREKARKELFTTEKNIDNIRWDKEYYDGPNHDILSMVSQKSRNILSIGCGFPYTEIQLAEDKHVVTAIPLDPIIGALAASKGIRVVEPDFNKAFQELDGTLFDCIILSEVLQHLENPLDILERTVRLLGPDGEILISVPNFKYLKFLKHHFPYPTIKKYTYLKHYLHMVDQNQLTDWLRSIGIQEFEFHYAIERKHLKKFGVASSILSSLFAHRLLSRAGRENRKSLELLS
jgi:2-polyprenyl-3-methyl-5-hydroxy-6-metoxy-1,4-benzoquinol methylase